MTVPHLRSIRALIAGSVIGASLFFGGQAGAQSATSDLASLYIQQSDLPSGYQPDTSGTTYTDTSACDQGNRLLMEADSATQGQAGPVAGPDFAVSALYTLSPYEVASGVLKAHSISEASEVVNHLSSRSYAQCFANASVTNGVVTEAGGGQASYGDQSTQVYYLAHDSSSSTFVGDFVTVARVGLYVVVLEDGALADSASTVADGVGQQTRNQLMLLLVSRLKSVGQGQQPPPVASHTQPASSGGSANHAAFAAVTVIGFLAALAALVLALVLTPLSWALVATLAVGGLGVIAGGVGVAGLLQRW